VSSIPRGRDKTTGIYMAHATNTITLNSYEHLMPDSEAEDRVLGDDYLDGSETDSRGTVRGDPLGDEMGSKETLYAPL
jgi:hypothetical protein